MTCRIHCKYNPLLKKKKKKKKKSYHENFPMPLSLHAVSTYSNMARPSRPQLKSVWHAVVHTQSLSCRLTYTACTDLFPQTELGFTDLCLDSMGYRSSPTNRTGFDWPTWTRQPVLQAWHSDPDSLFLLSCRLAYTACTDLFPRTELGFTDLHDLDSLCYKWPR